MLFSSVQYLLFFLGILAATWMLVGAPRLRLWALLLASYYFYASENGWLTLLILGSTQFDYWAAKAIAATSDMRRKRLWLAGSIAINLGVLGYFKYLGFLAQTASQLAGMIGWELGWVETKVMLPLGISFYTFEAISYVVDVYRGDMKPERRWHRFALFIMFFPHLIAGPIVRASQFLHQLDERPALDVARFERALTLVFLGLFKKIVIADTLAPIADAAFADPAGLDTVSAWTGVYAFALQIYFDFSGYTDIALGSALLLGIRLPANFDLPYAAVSITDFWRRWHLTLSTWLRDYVYFPLGGSRMATRWGVSRNLLLTMLIAGFWHGAGWGFLLWGLLHGLLLAGERFLGADKDASRQRAAPTLGSLPRRIAVFHLVAILWVFFRAETLDTAFAILAQCFDWNLEDGSTRMFAVVAILVAATLAIQLAAAWKPLGERIGEVPVFARAAIYGVAAFVIVMFNSDAPPAFIYFRF